MPKKHINSFLFQNIEQKNSRAATNTFYFYPWITLFGFLADWTGFLYWNRADSNQLEKRRKISGSIFNAF